MSGCIESFILVVGAFSRTALDVGLKLATLLLGNVVKSCPFFYTARTFNFSSSFNGAFFSCPMTISYDPVVEAYSLS